MSHAMKVIVSHPTGKSSVRSLLRALSKDDFLEAFWTTLNIPTHLTSTSYLPERYKQRLAQRSFGEASWNRTHLRPIREVARLIARSANITSLTTHEVGWACVDKIYHDLDRTVAKTLLERPSQATAVYTFEDGALETLKAARVSGRLALYELPIAHWRTLRKLLQEEKERLPAWGDSMQGLLDSAAKLERKDAEIEAADKVVVASTFTRDSLLHSFKNISVDITPYGCPKPIVDHPKQRKAGEPLQLLYAGHLSQRKGVADLAAAVSYLEVDWRLTIAAPKPATMPMPLKDFLQHPNITWLGKVPHQNLLAQMADAHALVFPSIAEGFGMVIVEALAAGLPVITTPNTAGPDILTEGVDGYIVPIRNGEAIADRITWLAENEDVRYAMAQGALKTAQRLSWSRYEAQMIKLMQHWHATSCP